jgi:hypothetical protein
MLWAKKRPPEVPAAPQALVPATLAVALDARLFERHFKALLAAAEDRDGIEAWLDALGEKQRRFAVALAQDNVAAVIDLVFGARRKLGPLPGDARSRAPSRRSPTTAFRSSRASQRRSPRPPPVRARAARSAAPARSCGVPRTISRPRSSTSATRRACRSWRAGCGTARR